MTSAWVVKQLGERYPRTTSHEGLDDGCFYCGVSENPLCTACWEDDRISTVQLHATDCLWAEARRIWGLEVLVCESAGHANAFETTEPRTPWRLREPDQGDTMAHIMWALKGQMMEQVIESINRTDAWLERAHQAG